MNIKKCRTSLPFCLSSSSLVPRLSSLCAPFFGLSTSERVSEWVRECTVWKL